MRLSRSKPLLDALKSWLEAQLAAVSRKSTTADAIRYALTRWDGLSRFLNDGRIEIDSNAVERAIRPIAIRESLYIPLSNICKHWNRVVVGNATRAPLSRRRGFDRFRHQVIGTDLIRRSGNNLHGGKDAGFDEAPYRVVCNA